MISNKQNGNDNFFGMKLQKISNNVSPFEGISLQISKIETWKTVEIN